MRIGFDLAEARAFFDGLSRCESKEALLEMEDGQIESGPAMPGALPPIR